MGTFTFAVYAYNQLGVDSLQVTIRVADQPPVKPVFVNKHPFIAMVGEDYEGWIEVVGYPRPTVSVTGLPKGFTVARQNDVLTFIEGKVSKVGKYPITITATNAAGVTTYPAVLRFRTEIYGQVGLSIRGNRTKLNKREIGYLRELVSAVPKKSTYTLFEITGRAKDTGHPAKDLKRAKARAWAIGKGLRKSGLTLKPVYQFNVVKVIGNRTSSWTDLHYTFGG